MSILGLIIAAGGLISIAFFGGGLDGYFYISAGLVLALFSSSWLRSRLGIIETKSQILYFSAVFFVSLCLLVIPVLIFGSPLASENTDAGLKKSKELIEREKYDAAKTVLNETRDEYGDTPGISQNLSALYLKKGEPDKAYQEIQLLQKNAHMYFNYALSFYQKESYRDAVMYLEKAIMLNPDMLEAYLYVGESYFRMNDFSAATYFFENAKNIRDDIPEVYYHCAKAELKLMQLEQAEENLEIAGQLDREGRLSKQIDDLHKEITYYNRQIENMEKGR